MVVLRKVISLEECNFGNKTLDNICRLYEYLLKINLFEKVNSFSNLNDFYKQDTNNLKK